MNEINLIRPNLVRKLCFGWGDPSRTQGGLPAAIGLVWLGFWSETMTKEIPEIRFSGYLNVTNRIF